MTKETQKALLFCIPLVTVELLIHYVIIDQPYLAMRQTFQAEFFLHLQAFPFQYRILSIAQAALLQKLGVPFEYSYLVIKGLWLPPAGILIFRFFMRAVSFDRSLIGLLFFLAALPLTFINVYFQETDDANLVFYLLGYFLIAERGDLLLGLLLAVSMLNRETPILLPFFWFLFRWDELPFRTLISRFCALVGVAFSTYAVLRFHYGHLPANDDFWNLSRNITDPLSFVALAVWLGPFLPFALRNRNSCSKFFQRGLLFVPFFVLFHFCIGRFAESRYLLPIFPLVAACALTKKKPSDAKQGDLPAQEKILQLSRRSSFFAYLALIVLFGASTRVYYSYVRLRHMHGISDKERANWNLKRGDIALAYGSDDEAATEWEKGLEFDSECLLLHRRLALLYSTRLNEPDKATKHQQEADRLGRKVIQ